MYEHARGDARAAVRDDLSGGNAVGLGCVPGDADRARNAAGDAVDRVRLAAVARRRAGVDDDDLAEYGADSSSVVSGNAPIENNRTLEMPFAPRMRMG